MGYGSVNLGYPVRRNVPNGMVQLDEACMIPEEFLPGMGFVEMEESIPVLDRKKNTLYGLVLVDFGGEDE